MAKRPLLPIPDAINPFRVKKQRLMNFNPVTAATSRRAVDKVRITVFEYDAKHIREEVTDNVENCLRYTKSDCIKWINVDGVRRDDVEKISGYFGVHALLMEDIMSEGQRAKMDEIGDNLFCLLPMIYFMPESSSIDIEQVSLVLGKNVVISFQDDPSRDVFNPIREKLRNNGTKLRMKGADYLLYALLDTIVDNYFVVMDQLGERIEILEEIIPRQPNNRTLARINFVRKETLLFKRAIAPVRELLNGLLKSENDLLREDTEKYFKDVYDHIVQANDLAESYRDLVMNLQELYHAQMNQKLNEVMKVLAVVTTLLAPMTVITGIYGMNFDVMPELRNPHGYFIVLGVMLTLFCTMIYIFRKRDWF
ncbi:magnesium/cobalt transporter CorA [Chitinophaga lutea]